MLGFDLFALGELLYLDSASLEQYIDRFYGVMHECNDDIAAIAEELLPKNYHGTQVEAELRELVEQHCEIKEDSLEKLDINHKRTLEKLAKAQKHLRKLHLHCFKKHLVD